MVMTDRGEEPQYLKEILGSKLIGKHFLQKVNVYKHSNNKNITNVFGMINFK